MNTPRRLDDVDLVIFDCDGVLVDSEPIAARVLLASVAETGVVLDAEEANARFLGRSMASITEILSRDYGCHIDEAALRRMRERLFDAFRQELRPIPGIAAALAALDRLGVPFCVASSSQMERISLALDVTGIRAFFGERVFSATMVRHGKPAPDLFLHAAHHMRVPPARSVVVEDSPAGIEAAQRAGMRVIGFGGGSHARNDRHRLSLERAAPDATFSHMELLPDILTSFGSNAEDA